MSSLSTPKFKKGQFVRCVYHFIDFYTYLYESDDGEYPYLPFYGIIVEVAAEDHWYEMETVYKIYCLDGLYRFLLEDEIELV
jgi:hypothetical protein